MMPRALSVFFALLLAVGAQAQHAYRQLREFGFVQRSAEQPLSGLVEGPGDWLYGTSYGGNGSVIYRVKKDGSEFSVLFDFGTTNGLPPTGPLILGSDGLLYGTRLLSESKGTSGALYQIQPDGSGFRLTTLPVDAQS